MNNKMNTRNRVLIIIGMIIIFLAGCFVNNGTPATSFTDGSKTSQSSLTEEVRSTPSESAAISISTQLPIKTSAIASSPSPTSTTLSPSTPSSTMQAQSLQVIAVGDGFGSYFIFDPKTGNFRPINPDMDKLYLNNIYGWSINGNRCTLITQNGELNIREIDLQGNIVREITSYDQLSPLLPADRIHTSNLDFSREFLFISFFNGRDNCHPGMYDWQCDTFDAYVYNIMNGTLKLVVENTHSRAESWSSQGDLALVKKDNSGVDQVFIYQTDKSNIKQITNFKNPDNEILDLIFSPSGVRMAVMWDDNIHLPNVTILRRQKNEAYIEEANVMGAYFSWWIDEDRFLFYKNSYHPNELIIENISLNSQNEFKLTNSANDFRLAGPLTNPEQIGYFDREEVFHIFDITSMAETYKIKSNIPVILAYYIWLPLPSQFIGINSCTK